jgi:hypothetical protein
VSLVKRVEIGVGGVTTGVRERRRDKTVIWWAETNERGRGQVEGKSVGAHSMGAGSVRQR